MIRARLLGARQEEVLPQGAANCGQGLEEAGGALGTGACQPCVRLLSCVAVSLPARDRGGWRRLWREGKGKREHWEGSRGAGGRWSGPCCQCFPAPSQSPRRARTAIVTVESLLHSSTDPRFTGGRRRRGTRLAAACCRRGLKPVFSPADPPCRAEWCRAAGTVLQLCLPLSRGELACAEAAWPAPPCPASPPRHALLPGAGPGPRHTSRCKDQQRCTWMQLRASPLNL